MYTQTEHDKSSLFMVGTSPTERGTHRSKEVVCKSKVEVRTCFISTVLLVILTLVLVKVLQTVYNSN